MVKQPVLLEHLLSESQQLSPDEQLQLIARIAERVMTFVQPQNSRRIVFGQFQGKNQSTLTDFAVAEWHPTEQELNGI